MIAIKKLFEEAGIEDVRPTDEALKAMGLSRRRFTQLVEGTNKTDISVSELISIKAWVKRVTEINPEEVMTSEIH
ncbi:hypothetical protein [Cyclobacterium jeungdonense]|uniref:XRE family transcriptional regulator n=1 Tax=Cyclobacterium jeungdonense TaxID=708087 RepID=A0ABT8C9L5_9BACT|nr:hypothetical protein [Cyclobacterium jeungdonense]MDN3689061.1 hypothetical protein [Cyclobacterium jeungdonense]